MAVGILVSRFSYIKLVTARVGAVAPDRSGVVLLSVKHVRTLDPRPLGSNRLRCLGTKLESNQSRRCQVALVGP